MEENKPQFFRCKFEIHLLVEKYLWLKNDLTRFVNLPSQSGEITVAVLSSVRLTSSLHRGASPWALEPSVQFYRQSLKMLCGETKPWVNERFIFKGIANINVDEKIKYFLS